jgi:hypothetical protein
MSEKVVLELPEEITRKAREESARSGQTFEKILIDWLERSAANADVYPLRAGAEYAIETPYGNEDAAQTLMDFLNTSQSND